MTDPLSPLEILINKAEAALHEPGSAVDAPTIDALLQEILSTMQSSTDARKLLGPLIGPLRAAIASATSSPIHWIPVDQGHLAIGHRPKIKTIQQMIKLGTTHVCTLLSESEGALDIGDEARRNGLVWVWLPLQSGNPPLQERKPEIVKTFLDMRQALNDRARIFIHCSAGIHRTGMITYAFLRYLQFASSDAIELLRQLRKETSDGVGDDRKHWGEQFGCPLNM